MATKTKTDCMLEIVEAYRKDGQTVKVQSELDICLGSVR
jgi:hypothetical protein